MSFQNGYMPPSGGGYGPLGYPPPPPPPPPPVYYAPPAKNPWRRALSRNANIVCLCLIIWFVLGIFLSLLFSVISGVAEETIFYFADAETLSLIEMCGGLLAYVLMFAITILIIRAWIGIPYRIAFPMRNPRASIAFPAMLICAGSSLIGVMCYAAISAILGFLFHVEPMLPEWPDPVGAPAFFVYILWLTVAPAVLEELLFRGVIMQSLRRFGDMFALICSSVLFSLSHQSLAQGPNAFLLGLIIGFFTLRTGSLKTGMLMHFFNNLLAVSLDFLSRGMTEPQQGLLSIVMFIVYATLGFLGLLMVIRFNGGIFHLAPSNYPMSAGKKFVSFYLSAASVVYIIICAVITLTQFQSTGWY